MNFKINKKSKPKKIYLDLFLSSYLIIGAFILGCLFYRSGTIPKIKHFAEGLLLKLEKPKSFTVKPKYSLNIDLKFKDWNKLIKKRNKAYEIGLLINDSDSFVPAKIGFNKDSLDAKIRLKGDNLDHLQGDKWSFRIKLKGDDKILGMNVFSLQHPKTRGYLKEYLIHKLADSQGLINLRYEFVNLIINGKNKGIYALEEHFSKYLIENNNRRDGPILKFDESATWENEQEFRGIKMKYWNEQGSFLSSGVTSFEKFEDLKESEPEKFALYKFGISQLEKFKYDEIDASRIFDVEQWGKLFALCDLTGSQHGVRWHNIRFYLNPISRLFEPILYDASVDNNPHEIIPVILKSNYDLYNLNFVKKIFSDIKIYDKYLHFIYHFIDNEIIDGYFNNNISDINKKELLLHSEFPGISYNYKQIYIDQFNYISNYFFPNNALTAYYYGQGTNEISIGNLQSIPVKLLNLEDDKKNTIMKFNSNRLPGKFLGKIPLFHGFNNNLFNNLNDIDYKKYKINFNFIGSEKVFSSRLKLRIHPTKLQFMTNSEMLSRLQENDIISFDSDNKIIKVKQGVWSCSSSLIIPPNYKFIIDGNTTLDLIEKAKIVSYSPVIFSGSNNRCIIRSSDFSSEGITILNSRDESIFEKVDFHNLANLKDENWFLSGSINIYKSKVIFDDCTFNDLHGGDDALNVIESDFRIDGCIFQNSYSDALDIDFGRGSVTNSFFVNSGNDALDISGADVNASHLFIDNTGDKAVSVGERSSVSISNFNITKAEIGLACKDGSLLNVDNSDFNNTRIGICAYIKKPEYGPANVQANRLEGLQSAEIPFLLEQGSKITYDSRSVKPNDYNVRSILYGIEYGKSSK